MNMDIKSSIKMMGVSSQFGIDQKNLQIINYLIQVNQYFGISFLLSI